MSVDASGSGVPPLRSFQYDSNAISEVASAVNLFRGAVALPIELVGLAGVNGLDVSITATYDGKAAVTADRSNRIMPTGILGLGWDIPFQRIAAAGLALDDSPNNAYALFSESGVSALVRLGPVTTGPQRFELEAFRFWNVVYEPTAETWTVTHENGTIYVFGDTSSERNTVQWGIRWNNWTGSSVALGQRRFATTWNLSEIRSPFGDTITFAYDVVEQTVSMNGPSYTKACYLASVTDPFDRRVQFVYSEKQFKPGNGVCEYADPHKLVPSNVPDAYQSRYETSYLERIDVQAASGAVLFSIAFGYEIRQFTKIDPTDPTFPYFAKRCLTSIVQSNAKGESLPGFAFTYADTASVFPAALGAMTYPAGATASFTYERQEIKGTGRTLQIAAPVAGAIPRVWHGPDYVVVTWTTPQQLYVTAYSWNGRWIPWSPESPIPATVGDGSLVVIARPQFFVVTFRNTEGTRDEFHAFRPDPTLQGRWTRAFQSVAVTAGASKTVLASGAAYFVAYNAAYTGGPFAGFGWNVTARAWTPLPAPAMSLPPSATVRLGAYANAYVAAAFDPAAKNVVFGVVASDGAGTWAARSQWSNAAAVQSLKDEPAFEIACGDCFLFLSFATSIVAGEPGSIGYTVRTWQLNSSFMPINAASPVDFSSSVALWEGKVALPPLALAYSDAVAGNNRNVLRFTGDSARPWQSTAFDVSDVDHASFAFAYGADVAVMTQTVGETTSNSIASYDPNRTAWTIAPILAQGKQPTSSGNVVTVGSTVLVRSPDGSWRPANRGLAPGVVDGSVQNWAPSYLAYLDGAGNTRVALFRNDAIASDEVLGTNLALTVPNGGPGTALSSPVAFVAFPASGKFDAAQTLTLVQIAGPSILAPLADFPTTAVRLDDGFSGKFPYVIGYAYDQSTSTYDAASGLAQYGRIRSVVGSAETSSVPLGFTDSFFSNGYSTQAAQYQGAGRPINYARILNGTLLAQVMSGSDGSEVARIVNSFDVRTQVLGSDSLWRNLAGAYFVPALRLQMRDTVVTTVEMLHDYATGQQLGTLTRSFDADGNLVVNRDMTRFASSVYPAMASRNMLTQVAETIAYSSANGAPDVIDAKSVSTWQTWNGNDAAWAIRDTYDWRGTGDATFLPAWWAEGSTTSPDWRCSSATLVRNVRSQPARARDSSGTLAASLFARDGMMPVADFHNATPETTGATFCSFEPYEKPAESWSCAPASAGAVTTGDARVGTTSLCLSASAVLLRTQAVSAPRNRYVLCGWVKTSSDFGGDLTWKLTLGDESLSGPVAATAGGWEFRTWTATLASPASGTLVVALAATISAGMVLVDALAAFPLDATFSARALDEAQRVPTSQIGPNGEVTSLYFDNFARPIATFSNDGLASLKQQYLARSADPAPLAAIDPNRAVSLVPRAGGFVDTFPDGDLPAWECTGTGWAVTDRALRFAGSATSPLDATATYRNFVNPENAIRVFVDAPDACTAVGIGDYFTTFDPATTTWTLVKDAAGIRTTLASIVAHAAEDWFLTVVDGRIIFTANGRTLFDLVLKDARSNAGRVVLGASGIAAFRQLIVAAAPTYTVGFLDGTFKQRQGLRLVDATTAIRSATLFDLLHRPAVTTTPSIVDVPEAYGYDADYVTNGTPGDSLWTGAPLLGNLAQTHPNAAGYPFERTTYETSPLGREIARGYAGFDFAIRPGNTHVQTTTYGTTTDDDATGLLSGKYFKTTVTSADAIAAQTFMDVLGKTLIVRAGIAEYGGITAESRFGYSSLGYMTSASPPARTTAVAPTVTTYDFLGRVASKTSPDTGTCRSMYDDAGQLRFLQTAAGANIAAPVLNYQKFDALGRIVESGTIPFLWDVSTEAALRIHAKDPMWPEAGVGWSRRYTFDSDGAHGANLVGRLWRVESNNLRSTGADVVETFEYTITGRITSKTLLCSAFDSTARVVANDYDAAGNVIRTATGGSDPDTVASYDRLMRVSTIGTVSQPDAYATYAYDASDRVVSEKLGPASNPALDRVLGLTPAGWPESIGDSAFKEELTYTTGGYEGAAYYDGSVASQGAIYAHDPAQDRVDRYANDALGRLSTVAASDAPTKYVYDLNGNVLSIADGRGTSAITYEKGTNRLARVDGDATDYVYDADGNVVAAPVNGLTIAYDTSIRKPRTITLESGTGVEFAYGDETNRVLKSSAGNAVLYVRGANPLPLFELIRRSGSAEERRQFVYGATGLIAVRLGETVWYVGKDHLGSIRVLADAEGTVVAAFDYTAFGETRVLIPDGPEVRYRFTGQEYDEETDLYNFIARLYEPRIGRFYEVDPAGQQPSPYVYVANAPARFVDKSGADFGLSLLIAVIIGIVIGAAVAGTAYAIINRDHFNWRDFGIAIGVGALGGGIAGAAGFAGPALLAAGAQAIGAATFAQSATFSVLAGAASGAAGSVLGQVVTNASLGKDIGDGLAFAAITGAIGGGIAGGIGWRMNVGKAVSYHGTSSQFVEAISRRINPPAPGVNFGGSQLGEGFYTSTQLGTARVFANEVTPANFQARILTVFSRRAFTQGAVTAVDEWSPLPWVNSPITSGYIANFDSLGGAVSGMPGRTQIKFNPRIYSDLWAFPEQPTGVWKYLSL